MKKINLLIVAMLLVGTVMAQAIKENKDAYIWGMSHRNTDAKGAAINLSTAQLYSMRNAVKKQTGSQVDLLVYHGKLGKAPASWYLVAPLAPGVEVDWSEKGTRPYCSYTGPKSDLEGPAHLKNWTVRNATKLAKVEVDYAKATEADIAALVLPDTYILPVAEGDVIAFETAATAAQPAKKGLIKIGAAQDDPERPDDAGKPAYQKLNLQIKVQK